MSCKKKPGSFCEKAMLAVALSTAMLLPPTIEARVFSGSVTERKQNRKIESMLKSAQKNYDAGKVQPAIDSYWKILELDPLETFAYLELGEIYTELRIYDRAIELLEPGLNMAEREMDQDTICHYYCILTNAHLGLNQTGLANKTLIKAAEAAPKNPMPRKILGDIYLANNRIADAMKAYRKAVELDPSYQPANEKLGELTARYGDQLPGKIRDKQAIKDKAVALPPAKTNIKTATQADPSATPKTVSTVAAKPEPTIATQVVKPVTGTIPAVQTPRPLPLSGVKQAEPDKASSLPKTEVITTTLTAKPTPMPAAAISDKTSATAATASQTKAPEAAPTADPTEIQAQLDKFLAGTPEEKTLAVNFFVKLEERGLTEIEELLYDPDPEVRILAARALPEFKAFTQRVKTMLEDAIDDPDPLVIEELNKALQKL